MSLKKVSYHKNFVTKSHTLAVEEADNTVGRVLEVDSREKGVNRGRAGVGAVGRKEDADPVDTVEDLVDATDLDRVSDDSRGLMARDHNTLPTVTMACWVEKQAQVLGVEW